MKNNPVTCDPKRIELFLQQKLSDDEQAVFEAHLDDCAECRRRLEATAAGADIWSGVRDSLQGEPPPADCLHSEDSATSGDGSFDHATVLKLLAPTDDDRMLGRLGAYEVMGVVGSGGMGVVLKALDAALNRYVAIKVLAPHLGNSGAARKRFAREAQAAAAVVHDNVMEIYGVADVEGLPYLVMPYVPGPSLQRRLDDDGPLALVEMLRIGMQAANGLAAAHAQGLVHRDVKPANILLASGVERVKLTDFGLARAADDASLTKTGIIAGTPPYMSPEQARGESVDLSSDLFSLGSVFYAMCTGRAPFRAETSYGVLRRVTDEEPRPIREINPDIPEWLCRIVARLMAKRPEARFASAREVATLLEECLAHVQQPATVPLPASVAPRSKGSLSLALNKAGVFVMIAALGLVLLGMVLWPGSRDPENQAAPSTPNTSVAETPPDVPQVKKTSFQPKREHVFAGQVTGHDMRVACSADGKRIAIANANPTRIMMGNGTSKVADKWKSMAQILDADTGKIVVSLKLTTAEEEAVLAATKRISHIEASALAFSPNGKMVAAGTSIGQVKLYSAHSGELIRSFNDEKAKQADEKTPENWKTLRRAMGSVASLAFSPDGSRLASCGGSFADFSEHFDGVMRLGFRVSGPGRLKVWEVPSGKLIHDLAGHNDQAYATCFSPDGRFLASAGRWTDAGEPFGNGVILWNAQSGKAIHTLIRSNANAGVRSIAFSPDSKLLLLGTQRFGDDKDTSTGGVSLVHASSGVEEWLVTVPGWARPVAFSPDGTSVIVLGSESIRLLETETGTAHHEIRPADTRYIDFAIASEAGTLAVGAVDKGRKGSIEVWRIQKSDSGGPPPATATEAPGTAAESKVGNLETRESVKTIACSENGKLIAIANGAPAPAVRGIKENIKDRWKPSAEILDRKTGKTLASLKLTTAQEDAVFAETEQLSHFEVTALALTADAGLVAVGTSVGQVKLFNPRTGDLIQTLDDEREKLADPKTPKNWKSLPRALGSVKSLAFSPDGSRLAVCGSSFADFARVFEKPKVADEFNPVVGRMQVWNVKDGRLLSFPSEQWSPNAVAFSPDGSVLACAGRHHAAAFVGLWNAETGQFVLFVGLENNAGAQSVAFSPDSRQLGVSTLHYDVDKANDAGTSTISFIQVPSGVVKWRRTLLGVAKPVAFYDGAVLALSGRQSMWFYDANTGDTLSLLHPDPSMGIHWNDFAIAKKGRMWVIGGENDKHKGSVEILDP